VAEAREGLGERRVARDAGLGQRRAAPLLLVERRHRVARAFARGVRLGLLRGGGLRRIERRHARGRRHGRRGGVGLRSGRGRGAGRCPRTTRQDVAAAEQPRAPGAEQGDDDHHDDGDQPPGGTAGGGRTQGGHRLGSGTARGYTDRHGGGNRIFRIRRRAPGFARASDGRGGRPTPIAMPAYTRRVTEPATPDVRTPSALPASRLFVALMWAIASGLALQTMNAVMRLMALELHSLQAQFLRALFGLVVMLPIIALGMRRTGWRSFWPNNMAGQWIRGVAHTVATLLFFLALPHLPLADSTAINFTIPLFILMGAALFLGEKVTPARWLATLVGFGGVLVVLLPHLGGIG